MPLSSNSLKRLELKAHFLMVICVRFAFVIKSYHILYKPVDINFVQNV